LIHFWNNPINHEVNLITELVTTNLLRCFNISHIKKVRELRLRVIKLWCREILEGLNYLHSLKPPIIHRDIKCDNIFINTHTSDIKIGDLGLAIELSKGVANSVIGTPEFMAPELYQEKYGVKIDIYSFGMCLLELITLRKPYEECPSPGNIFYKVTNKELPLGIHLIQSSILKEIVLRCIEYDPDKRPTAKQLLESE